MRNSYQAPPEGVNPQSQPRPSYWALIAAPVRYCKALPPAAKLLYGEIWALSDERGYCYAQSNYFMDLYEVDRRTVRRWLEALAAQSFIRVEYIPETGERHIYPLVMIAPGGGAKTAYPPDKNAPQINTEINTKDRSTSLNVTGVAAPRSQAGKGVASRRSSISALKKQAVAEVVELTGDHGSEKRFKQLYEIADRAGLSVEWDKARDATKTALKRSRKPIEAPGAYFSTILARALTEQGVSVPVGSPEERAEVRALIAQSLGGEVSHD